MRMEDNAPAYSAETSMTRRFVLLGFFVFYSSFIIHHSSMASGQEPKAKSITIRWYGQSFFQVEDSAGRKFAIDPHAIPAFGRVPVKADFVIVSHPHDDHSLIEMIDTGKKDARIAEA